MQEVYSKDGKDWIKHQVDNKTERDVKVRDVDIRKECYGFGFGDIVNKDMFNLDEKKIRYSFDTESYNFHIVPDKSDESDKGYFDRIEILKEVLQEKLKNSIEFKEAGIISRSRAGMGIYPHNKNHKWQEVIINEYSYLIAFQTLYCNDGIISCELGRVQLVACGKNDKLNIKENNQLFLMYPSDNERELIDWNGKNIRRVYNTDYRIDYNISDYNEEAKKIMKMFIAFVKQSIAIHDWKRIVLSEKGELTTCVTPISSSR